jgi:homoserine kinase type II
MAVYTKLTTQEIHSIMSMYFSNFTFTYSEISNGLQNTNYRIDLIKTPLSHESYILTLYENTQTVYINELLSLTLLLQEHALPIPVPIHNANQKRYITFNNKPCTVTPLIEGSHPTTVDTNQLIILSKNLAHMHTIDLDTLPSCTHVLPLIDNILLTAKKILHNNAFHTHHMLIREEVEFVHSIAQPIRSLPKSLTHNDLFRDNVLFVNSHLSALLDFNDATVQARTIDLAIIIHDWCFNEHHEFLNDHYHSLISTYRSYITLTSNELALWPALLRISACFIWLSRLERNLSSELLETHPDKDPSIFLNRLKYYKSVNLSL